MCLTTTRNNMASSAMIMCRTTLSPAIKVRFTAPLLQPIKELTQFYDWSRYTMYH